jgi:hypothetical protein
MTISGMFGTTILGGTILNQAAHDDKPPVFHGNKKDKSIIMLFMSKQTKCFLAYAMLNIGKIVKIYTQLKNCFLFDTP